VFRQQRKQRGTVLPIVVGPCAAGFPTTPSIEVSASRTILALLAHARGADIHHSPQGQDLIQVAVLIKRAGGLDQ
jgi:hypothetical protein